MVPMRLDILGVGVALALLATLIFRWMKNKVPKEKKGWKWLRRILEIAFVIWLLVVGICTARYLLDDWERAVAIHKMQPVVNYLEVGWRCIIKGPELIEAAKELPSRLPQVALLPPPPATPTTVPAVTLEELRRSKLPRYPLEFREVTAAEIETFSATRVVTEGITGTLTPTQTVTVQLFEDGTLLVSSKNVTETVVGAGGWVQKVHQVAELADKLDVIGRLPEKDNIRVELAQAMSQMRVVLEFSGVTTDPAAEYGPAFTETERLVNRLLTLSVAMGQNDTYQPPRGEETQVGTEHLQGLVMSYRNEYYLLLARHGVLADQLLVGKAKKDGPERRKLLADTETLRAKVKKLKSQLDIEMTTHGTEYEPVLLQKLNDMDWDLDIFVTKI